MSEHARADLPNHRPSMIDAGNRLEGLPLLRAPTERDRPPVVQDRERQPMEFYPAPIRRQRRRKHHRLSLVQRLHQRRCDFAMIGAALALSVIVGIALATLLR
jgi:hypothetical protein